MVLHQSPRRWRRALLIAVVSLGVVLPAGAAQASTDIPPDRVVVVDGPMPTGAAGTANRSAGPSENGVIVDGVAPVPKEYAPAPGQTVTVQYTDGVTSYTGVIEEKTTAARASAPAAALACVVSQSVGKPSLQSTRFIRASLSLAVGSGCGAADRGTGHLAVNWLGLAVEKASSQSSVINPGYTGYWFVSYNCPTSNASSWRASVNSGSAATQTTPYVTLNCGT